MLNGDSSQTMAVSKGFVGKKSNKFINCIINLKF